MLFQDNCGRFPTTSCNLSGLVNPEYQALNEKKQVCVQLPTSAENVSLPAFAAGCHAVRCGCCWEPGSNRSISPALRAHGSKPIAAACGGQLGQTDGWTNRHRDGHHTIIQGGPKNCTQVQITILMQPFKIKWNAFHQNIPRLSENKD